MNCAWYNNRFCFAAALAVVAGLLCCAEAGAQEAEALVGRPGRADSLLREDVEAYAARALRDRIISREKLDSIMAVVRDSLPAAQDMRLNLLVDIRDELDRLYDEYVTRLDAMAAVDYGYMSSSMLPSVLHEPEGLRDPLKERRRAELAAAMKVKEDALMHFGQEKSVIPKWAVGPLRLLFNAGMDTSGKTIAVHRGLYYINIPGGRPQPEPWTATIPKTTD